MVNPPTANDLAAFSIFFSSFSVAQYVTPDVTTCAGKTRCRQSHRACASFSVVTAPIRDQSPLHPQSISANIASTTSASASAYFQLDVIECTVSTNAVVDDDVVSFASSSRWWSLSAFCCCRTAATVMMPLFLPSSSTLFFRETIAEFVRRGGNNASLRLLLLKFVFL